MERERKGDRKEERKESFKDKKTAPLKKAGKIRKDAG